MWFYFRKFASIHGWSKGLTHFRNAKVATHTYIPKAYYGDHICFKEKQKVDYVPVVKCISEYFIKPKHEVEESKQPYHLAPHDLSFLSLHYTNMGLLFTKPSHINDREFSMHSFLESLQESLSLTLVHFYPLAGQLVTEVDKDKHESRVFVDCNKGPGVRFIHATLDMTVFDILSPNDVPVVVESFFDLNEESVNYDGHSKPLLSVQVTELLDGIFIACSMNHCIADGTSYWHFWKIWSEIYKGIGNRICESGLPVYARWCTDGRSSGPFPIPYIHPDEFVRKFETPQVRDRIFHFSSKSIVRVKAKANEESYANNISSFQALCALLWRSIVRSNHLPHDQVIHNHLIANGRERLNPPLPKYYFGNCIQPLTNSTTAGELLQNNLGWAASLLHQSVVNFNDRTVRDYANEWLKSPHFYYHADIFNRNSVTVGNSPKFDMYGIEFGLGKAVSFRTGRGYKATGMVYAFPGSKEKGSVDIELYLPPDSMNALELDKEFMAFISLQ